MSKIKRVISVVIIGAFLAGTLALTGCTRYANEDQLKQLEETKNAALKAEEKIKELTTEKSSLEKKVAAKKAELENVKKEKETVKERLSQKQ